MEIIAGLVLVILFLGFLARESEFRKVFCCGTIILLVIVGIVVVIIAESKKSPTPPPLTSTTATVRIANKTAVRSTPYFKENVIDTVYANQEFLLIGETKVFYKIQHPKGQGYVEKGHSTKK